MPRREIRKLRRRPWRRGFSTPVVLFLLVLCTLLVFTFQGLVRQKAREAARFQSVISAEYLAEAGLGSGLQWLRSWRQAGASSGLESIFERAPAGLEGLRVDVPPVHFDALCGVLPQEAQLRVWVEFHHIRSFVPEEGHFGLRPDPLEKFGEIRVISRAQVQGYTRSLTQARQFKLLRPVVPVLSKFTFFLQGPSQDWNHLERRDGQTWYEGQARGPLVLQNHPWSIPSYDSQELLPLGPSFPDLAQLEAGGWVFLGGPEPWTIQPSDGVVHGESFQWMRQPVDFPSSLPGVQREQLLGLGFGNGRLAEVSYQGVSGLSEWDQSFPLFLFGDAARVSPTLVFGEVRQRVLWVRGIDGLVVPWCGSGLPCESSFPGGAEAQAERRPRILEGPILESLGRMQENQEGATLDLDPAPSGLGAIPTSALVRVDFPGASATPLAQAAAGSSESLALLRDDGSRLFEGSLYQLDGDWLERVLAIRSTHLFEDAEALYAAGFPSQPELQKGVFLLRQGNLSLPPGVYPPHLVLVVPGNIRVRPGFRVGPGEGPLTLVSLGGNIEILGAEEIPAHLVALRGQVHSAHPWRIRGGVAVGSWDPTRALGPDPGLLAYNEALDGTSLDRARTQLQLFLEPRTKLYQGGAP